jgi:hypothetical protein
LSYTTSRDASAKRRSANLVSTFPTGCWEISLDRDDPPQAPEQKDEPQHELGFSSRPGVAIRDTAASNAVIFGAISPWRRALRLDCRSPSPVLGLMLPARRRLVLISENEVIGRLILAPLYRVYAEQRLDVSPFQPSPTFPTGALILEFCRRKLNLFKGR